MNIGVVAKTRLPIAEPFRGGLEAFTFKLCQEYTKLGHKVTLYAHADSDPALNVRSFYGNEYREDKQFEIYENDEYLSILSDIEKGDFDVIHNNSSHELPIIWGAKASIPMVSTIHTPPIAKLKAAIKIFSGADNLHFVTPSEFSKAEWTPYMDKGATVIYNGVDLDQWPLARKRSDYLFWFGRIVQAKGLDIVLDAAHKINIPLRFAGPIDDRKYFVDAIEPRITSNDNYLGHLNQSDILLQMEGASALVSAVRWEEPFGLTTIEAMASGVPVAGFNRGAFVELVDVHSGVVAEQRNVVSLAEAIESAIMLDSSKVRHRSERFSLRKMAETYIDHFRGLL